jgi:pyridoxal/pyridoxine/pyridoxamine kinase
MMVAASGDVLLEPEAIAVMRDVMLPLATVVTPNLREAGILTRREVRQRRYERDIAKDKESTRSQSVLTIRPTSAIPASPTDRRALQLGATLAKRRHYVACKLSYQWTVGGRVYREDQMSDADRDVFTSSADNVDSGRHLR